MWQMFLHSFKKDVTSREGVISLGETGLGLFDAFFASLSMIIVSEVGTDVLIFQPVFQCLELIYEFY